MNLYKIAAYFFILFGIFFMFVEGSIILVLPEHFKLHVFACAVITTFCGTLILYIENLGEKNEPK